MQHKSRCQSILLGLQGHIDAEHNGAQLVPEVGLVLGRGQESGHLATMFPTTDHPRTHSAQPVPQGWMNKLAHPALPIPSPAYPEEGRGGVADGALPSPEVQVQGGARLLRVEQQHPPALAGLLPVQLQLGI